MIKRHIFVLLSSLLLLSACDRSSKNTTEEDQKSEYNTAFIEQTQCGIYSLKDDFSKKTFLFDEDECQFICSGKSSKVFYKILDFKNFAYLHLDFASGVTALKENSTVRANLESNGIEALSDYNGQTTLEVVKVSGNLCYLRDNVNNIGYIIFE